MKLSILLMFLTSLVNAQVSKNLDPASITIVSSEDGSNTILLESEQIDLVKSSLKQSSVVNSVQSQIDILAGDVNTNRIRIDVSHFNTALRIENSLEKEKNIEAKLSKMNLEKDRLRVELRKHAKGWMKAINEVDSNESLEKREQIALKEESERVNKFQRKYDRYIKKHHHFHAKREITIAHYETFSNQNRANILKSQHLEANARFLDKVQEFEAQMKTPVKDYIRYRKPLLKLYSEIDELEKSLSSQEKIQVFKDALRVFSSLIVSGENQSEDGSEVSQIKRSQPISKIEESIIISAEASILAR